MQQLIITPDQVGEILRGRRKARRIPQRELARKLGVSQNRLSALESHPGRLTLERMIAAANLLGLEIVIRDRPSTASKPEW
jgi:HTH-type transcriptional regulator/antitoxin HipB